MKHHAKPESSNGHVPLTVRGTRVAGARPSRREAMQWVLGAMAASALPSTIAPLAALGQEVGRTPIPQEKAATMPSPTFKGGYGVDPNLTKVYKPGDVWPLTFNDEQRTTATALADTIIPKDQYGPAASEVGVVEMIDEWISAPYPQQQSDRPVILEGLSWLEIESARRFSKRFTALDDKLRRAICDDICFAPEAKPEFRKAAGFFGKFRGLAAGAYYATPEGWEAIGYIGNVALPRFDGPPPEVLAKLGVTQTVKDVAE